jgi:hypothetical protein
MSHKLEFMTMQYNSESYRQFVRAMEAENREFQSVVNKINSSLWF